MKKSHRFSKRRTNHTGLKLTLFITAAILVLFVGLGSVVVMDNNNKCSEIGLTGFLLDKCYSQKGYKFSRLALVVGNTANTPEPSIDKELTKYLAASLIDEDSEMTAYSVTPDKKKLYIERTIAEADNLDGQVEATKSVLENIDNTIATPPTASGAMYLETITRAARSMSVDKDNEGVIIIIGSGLSDNGLLNFADNDLLHMDTEKIMDAITADGKEAIVKDSLKHFTVVWSGIGETANPQSDLKDDEIENLKDIYDSIFNYMGAKKVIFKGGTEKTESVKTNYKVKTVKSNDWKDVWSGGVTFDETKLAFVGNKASLKDPSAAKKVLSELAENLKNDTSAKVTIEGYVAKAGCNGSISKELSSERANAVKKLLISMGISGDRIAAIGKGWGGNNECPKGSWNENVAKKNRIVKIYVK